MKLIFTLLSLIIFGCISKHETNIPNPEKFEIIAQCAGDLDKDGKKQ